MIYEVKKPFFYELLNKWVVEIYIGDAFWNHMEFDSEDEAKKFYDDPLKEDREASERRAARIAAEEEEKAKYRAFGFERIRTGRRVGRKPGAA